MWFTILIIAIIIGAIIGFISSEDDEKGSGCMAGAFTGGMGCGYLLLQIFLAGLFILGIIWLFGVLF